MKKVFILIAALIMLPLVYAWADAQSDYVACKQTALENLKNRYARFDAETGASGAAEAAGKFDAAYKAGITACNGKSEPEKSKCLDGALNNYATRYSTEMTSQISSSSTTATETYAKYQSDYQAATVACQDKLQDAKQDEAAAQASCVPANISAINACASTTSSATTACDPNSVKSVSAPSAAGGVNKSCSDAQQTMTDAQTALTNYQQACTAAKTACNTTCEAAKTKMNACAAQNNNQNIQADAQYQSVFTNSDACSILVAKTEEARQAVATYNQTKSAATDCSDDTSSSTTAADKKKAAGADGSSALGALGSALQAMAGATPDVTPTPLPSLAADESCLGTQAGSITCICAMNPRAAGCPLGAQEKASANDGMSSVGGGVASGAANTNLNLSGGDPNLFDTQPARTAGGPSDESNGRKGGAANINGQPGGPAGAAPEKKSFAQTVADYASSFFGGSGGGGGGGGFSSGSFADQNRMPAAKQSPKTPDLWRFLPGQDRDPKRFVGGQVGVDGLAGANSNLWQNMQNRYQSVSPSLLPH